MSQHYSPEFKAEAVKRVLEQNQSMSQVSRDLKIALQTLSNWVNQARWQARRRVTRRLTNRSVRSRSKTTQKSTCSCRDGARNINKSGSVLRQGRRARYAFVKAYTGIYPISLMCRVLSVSISAYYAWLTGKPTNRQQRNIILTALVKAAHIKTRETYGVERLHAELKASGVEISLYKVRKLRNQLGLRCKQVKRFKCTTNNNHDKPIAANLLGQQFTVERPNQAWSSDITYVWTDEGWLYVAGVKDLYSKEIVGYAIGSRMTTDLCLDALNMAIKRRRPKAGLIIHSDRGSQYCSKAYRQFLDQHKFECSMSRKGNCYDNAPIESFWGSLKNELIHQKTYEYREKAKAEIVEYIEIFYNRIRRHTKLGNITPYDAFSNYMRNAA